MNRKILVKKSTKLATSFYSLSLIEHRFINMCVGGIHKDQVINDSSKCKVYTERFAQEYGIAKKEALSQLKEIQKTLPLKQVIFPGEYEVEVDWVKAIDLINNDEFYVEFDEEIIPHLFNLKEWFIKYELDLIKHMKSIHSIRLYEICKTVAYDKAGWKLTVQVEELKLKLMLAVGDKYELYGSFKKVLEGSLSEINQQTDIKVELQERRKGRKVATLIFMVERKL